MHHRRPRASYQDLLADIDANVCAHEVVVAVQVRATKSLELGVVALEREVSSLSPRLGRGRRRGGGGALER